MLKKRLPVLFSLILFSFILLSGCSSKSSPSPSKPVVWVSIAPYQEIVQRIIGPEVEVTAIVPAGADPHSFEPTSRQTALLDQGVVWFRIGEPFEQKLLPLLKTRNPDLVILDLRTGVDLIKTEEGCAHCRADHQDRHIWMSPTQTSLQAVKISEILSQKFPHLQENIRQNLALLQSDLSDLNNQINELLAPLSKRTFLVSHPAFAYFCRDYRCEQLSVEYEGKEPRPQQVELLLRQAAEKRTSVAIALPQHNNKGTRLIADKLRLPIETIDPYSPQYFDTLLDFAKLIASTAKPE